MRACWVLITHIVSVLEHKKQIDHKAVGECVLVGFRAVYATDLSQGYHKTTDMITHIITILGHQKQIDHKAVGECALLGSVLSMQQIDHKAVGECALSWVQYCLSCSAD